MLVAARMSSLRISLPSFIGTCSGSITEGDGVAALLVYGAAFGCSTCLLRLSNGFGRAFGTVGIVSAFRGIGRAPWSNGLVELSFNALGSSCEALTPLRIAAISSGSSKILSSAFGKVVDLLLVCL